MSSKSQGSWPAALSRPSSHSSWRPTTLILLEEFVEFALFVREVVNQGVNLPAENVPRPRFRDRQNPLEYFSDGEFLYRYRFTKETVVDLLARLRVEENDTNRGLPIPPMLQLLIALHFYGAGTFQVVTGDLVNVSQPTVCRAVKRMSELIAGCLFRAEVTFTDRPESFHDIACDFYKIAKFPGVTGCIDCTHVRIKAPGGPNGEVYRNRKGHPGSWHDSRIFDKSRARVLYETKRVPGLLLGDAGYACLPYLMTPLADPGAPGSPEARYATLL
ncbi:hypothetical protein HPB48_012452 [Haemaphysalis longicornis]|uniref:DDE Tnp4 domain-containing protein n=1 Tax=Haemaphysalis longicornis TaxID=44386 RepID=A0A9J6FUG5_HAELO|nr:hypothetical protein HPB48_012452 [Haemaphysalis longicornis]